MDTLESLWTALKANDMSFYLKHARRPMKEFTPMSLVSNPEGAEALVRIHRYQTTGRTVDAYEACRCLSESISLNENPEYAYFFHLASIQAMEEFEFSVDLQLLDRSIDVLEPFLASDQDPHTKLMASIRFACLCLQYSLVANNQEPLQSALDTVTEARSNPVFAQWSSSSFGETRSLVFIAHAISRLYHSSFPPKNMVHQVSNIKRVLDALPPVVSSYTALQTLVLSVLLLVVELKDDRASEEALNILVLSLKPHGITSNAPLRDTTVVDGMLDRAQLKTSTRVICLLHMADTLERHDIIGTNQQIEQLGQGDTSESWYEEWEDARLYLRQRLESLQNSTETNPNSGLNSPLTLFNFTANVESTRFHSRMNSLSRVPDGHSCLFKFVIRATHATPANADLNSTPHHVFFLLVQHLLRHLTYDQIEELIQHPEAIPFSPHLTDLDGSEPKHNWIDHPLAWRRSPGIMALLVLHPTRLDRTPTLQDYILASRYLLRVTLSKEPGFTSTMYSFAVILRCYERDSEAINSASSLFKEFLCAQSRGTMRHWVAVVDLAVNCVLEYTCGGGSKRGRSVRHPELFAFALELFREALEIDNLLQEEWVLEVKRIIIIGRILQHRLKWFWFCETEDSLREATSLISNLWKLLPPGAPFRASVLETIVISTMSFLAQKMPTRRWLSCLKLLASALELRLTGELPNDSKTTQGLKYPHLVAQDLISSGIELCKISFMSEAICLLHISDLVRTLALDCSKHQGILAVSLDMYHRSLALPSHPFDDGGTLLYHELQNESDVEKGVLNRMVELVLQNLARGVQSSAEQPPLTIYHYRATTSQPSQYGSISHTCVLGYYPTRILYIEVADVEDAPMPSPTSISSSNNATSQCAAADNFPQWPSNLLYIPNNSEADDRTHLPSTVLPFIRQINLNNSPALPHHPVFEMPLCDRSIQAYIRNLHAQVRFLDGDVSMLTEAVIRQNTSTLYWNPADVLLDNRLEKLKENTPYFTWVGPLQTLIARGPERCLELVEVARSLFWSKLLRLRTPFDDFPLPAGLKEELKEVAEELGRCKSQSERDASPEEARRQYDLEWRFNYLLQDARAIPGVEGLLMPKDYQQLLEVAEPGPVVMLIGGDSIYAALIIQKGGVDSIFLDQLSEVVLDGMIIGLNKATNAARGAMMHSGKGNSGSEPAEDEGRGARKKVVQAPSYGDYLAQMWQCIVKPILEFLHLRVPSESRAKPVQSDRPRLWWCPTGKLAFLPLHAAGIDYGLPSLEATATYVVSSYTPTLSALIEARAHHSSPMSGALKTLVLAQPTTKGHNDLPMTLKELQVLESIVPSENLIRLGDVDISISKTNVNRTVSEAIRLLSETSILHLACHGHQDRGDPLNSGFQLEDGRLTVSYLISTSTPKAALAFLSACESASNDFSVPDESLNLAVAMLYAGFGSVIGTMWSMNDNDGPEVTRTVYQAIFEHPAPDRMFDPDIIPRALDAAIQGLQAQHVHPSRWATYIHVGI